MTGVESVPRFYCTSSASAGQFVSAAAGCTDVYWKMWACSNKIKPGTLLESKINWSNIKPRSLETTKKYRGREQYVSDLGVTFFSIDEGQCFGISTWWTNETGELLQWSKQVFHNKQLVRPEPFFLHANSATARRTARNQKQAYQIFRVLPVHTEKTPDSASVVLFADCPLPKGKVSSSSSSYYNTWHALSIYTTKHKRHSFSKAP